MQSINFNDGYKEFAVNGDENNVIRVNVTDINIVNRMKEAMNKCDEAMEKLDVNGKATPDVLLKADTEIRATIDEAFGSDICTHAFGSTNALSPVSDGKPICISFLEAFTPIIMNEIKEVKAASSVMLEEKTDKYIKQVIATSSMPEMTDEQKAFMEFLASRNSGVK